MYARYSVLKNKQDFTSFNHSISLLRTYVRSQRSWISAINLSSLEKQYSVFGLNGNLKLLTL